MISTKRGDGGRGLRGLLGPAEWYGDPELSDLCGTKDEDENVENLTAYYLRHRDLGLEFRIS